MLLPFILCDFGSEALDCEDAVGARAGISNSFHLVVSNRLSTGDVYSMEVRARESLDGPWSWEAAGRCEIFAIQGI